MGSPCLNDPADPFNKDKQEKAIARKARALDRKVAKAQLKKLKKEQEIKENQNKPKKERFANTKELAMDAARIGVKTMATSGFAALAKALFPEEESSPVSEVNSSVALL